MEAGRCIDSRIITAREAHMRVVRSGLGKIDQVALDEALKFIMDKVERSSDMGVPVLTFILGSDEEKREYAPIYAIEGGRNTAMALEHTLHDLGYRASVLVDPMTDHVIRIEMSWRT